MRSTPTSFNDVALALSQPLDWSEVTESPAGETLRRLANGPARRSRLLSLPVRAIAGEHGLLLLVANASERRLAGAEGAAAAGVPGPRQLLSPAHPAHLWARRRQGHADLRRELDCLKWIAAGKTAWEASVILGISERTVRFHLNGAREKLNCMTTTQAVAKAVSQQLI